MGGGGVNSNKSQGFDYIFLFLYLCIHYTYLVPTYMLFSTWCRKTRAKSLCFSHIGVKKLRWLEKLICVGKKPANQFFSSKIQWIEIVIFISITTNDSLMENVVLAKWLRIK